jgi:tryptophan synthase alpha subunit
MKPITAYYSVKEVVKRDLIPTGLTGLLPLSYTVTGSVNDTGTVIRTVKTRCHPGLASGFSVKTDFKLTQWLRASDAAAITNQLLRSIRFA